SPGQPVPTPPDRLTRLYPGLLLLSEVVDGDTAYGLRGEVRRYPGRDRRGASAAAEAIGAAPDVVVDLVLGDHRLELGQRRRRVGAVEAADPPDGLPAAPHPA